jgi:hypothetical protein
LCNFLHSPVTSSLLGPQVLGLQVITAVNVKMTIFWDTATCSLVNLTGVSSVLTALIFRLIKLISLRMEAASTSETSVSFYETDETSQKTATFKQVILKFIIFLVTK